MDSIFGESIRLQAPTHLFDDSIPSDNPWDVLLWESIQVGLYTTSADRLVAENLVRKALENGADPETSSYGGQNALNRAVWWGSIKMLQLLIDAGVRKPQHSEALELLDACGRHQFPSASPYRCLEIKCEHQVTKLGYLFQKKFLETIPFDDLMSYTHQLVLSGSVRDMDLFPVYKDHAIAIGCELSRFISHAFSLHGHSMLHNAVNSRGCERVWFVRLLISYGADVLQKDRSGFTPRHLAMLRRDIHPQEREITDQVVAILREEEDRCNRRTAVAMALHGRLGTGSRLNELEPEHVRQICDLSME
jgi:ankyrin repeat protein